MTSLLDFGPQPICNRYLAAPDAPEERFPLHLGHCTACGLIQLMTVASPDELRPRYEGLKYEEAEGHLDDMTEEIIHATRLTRASRIVGFCYKEASTLRRLRERGYENTYQLDPVEDFGVSSPCAGIETLQQHTTPERCRAIAARRGKAHVVIVRHVLEHAHDHHAFVRGLTALLAPGGFLVLEVPGFSIPLDDLDYSTIWEEHTAYFTPVTFQGSLPHLGLKILHFLSYPYPLENSLVAIAQPAGSGRSKPAFEPGVAAEVERAHRFAAALPRVREATQAYLAEKGQAGPVAMFGAGHLSAKFINLLDLGRHVDFVLDDHPKKKGLFMPGSRLPILPSSTLLEKNVALCLLSLKAETEQVVLKKHPYFVEKRGAFATIFPAGELSLRRHVTI